MVDKCNYLGVILESTGHWNKQKTLARAQGYQALVAIDQCTSVTPNIKVHTEENIYEIVCVNRKNFKTDKKFESLSKK
jgi:hypothetical protein